MKKCVKHSSTSQIKVKTIKINSMGHGKRRSRPLSFIIKGNDFRSFGRTVLQQMEKYQVEKYQSTQVENDYQPLSFTLTTSVKIQKLIG